MEIITDHGVTVALIIAFVAAVYAAYRKELYEKIGYVLRGKLCTIG